MYMLNKVNLKGSQILYNLNETSKYRRCRKKMHVTRQKKSPSQNNKNNVIINNSSISHQNSA